MYIVPVLTKGIDMVFANAQTLIMVSLIFAVIALVIWILWGHNKFGSYQDLSTQLNSDLSSIREIMINDSHLHRLLMIEIINNKIGGDHGSPITGKIGAPSISGIGTNFSPNTPIKMTAPHIESFDHRTRHDMSYDDPRHSTDIISLNRSDNNESSFRSQRRYQESSGERNEIAFSKGSNSDENNEILGNYNARISDHTYPTSYRSNRIQKEPLSTSYDSTTSAIYQHSSNILSMDKTASIRAKHLSGSGLQSEAVTFSEMSNGMVLFGKSLIRSFGVTISQRIATLMNKRNEILREYYWSMRNFVCDNGNCYILESLIPNMSQIQAINNTSVPLIQREIFTRNNENRDDFVDGVEDYDKSQNEDQRLMDMRESEIYADNETTRPVFPATNFLYNFSDPTSKNNEIINITTITQRKLEAITREITDNIAASFHIRDVDQTSNKNRPITHFQRVFNLLSMYDKELINQAKSYASLHYDISMNCAQSSLEITRHLSDEFNVLMNESNQMPKTSP